MDADNLYHVSVQSKLVPIFQPQLYVYGYNAGGRPDGVWFATGDTWMRFGNRTRAAREYKHHIRVDASRLFTVDSDLDMHRLYTRYGGYWVNYDYFNLNFRDVVTGKHYEYMGKLRLLWSNLTKTPGQSARDILLQNGVIADSVEGARMCDFYRDMDNETIERFRFPDWGRVSKHYAGLWVTFSRDSANMRYFWYQSLDASSGCVWDSTVLRVVRDTA